MDGEAEERVQQKQKRRRDNVELSFAQRLAGNEKKIRDRAVKKLKQWITARSQKSGKLTMNVDGAKFNNLFVYITTCDVYTNLLITHKIKSL